MPSRDRFSWTAGSECSIVNCRQPGHNFACCFLLRSAVQVALQDHLSRNLIYVAARLPRVLACVAQCAMRCHGGQAFIPSDNRARQNCAQLFYKLEDFSRSGTKLTVHLFG